MMKIPPRATAVRLSAAALCTRASGWLKCAAVKLGRRKVLSGHLWTTRRNRQTTRLPSNGMGKRKTKAPDSDGHRGDTEKLCHIEPIEYRPLPQELKPLETVPNGSGRPGHGVMHVTPVVFAACKICNYHVDGCCNHRDNLRRWKHFVRSLQ